MVKVIYNGDMKVCRIKVHSALFKSWAKGEIKEISDNIAKKLLKDNKNFKLVDGSKIKEVEVKEKKVDEKYDQLDLNRDGKVDHEDASIAGKTLARMRKNK